MLRVISTVICFCLLLAACGYKGDLYLPDTEKQEIEKRGQKTQLKD